MHGDLQINPKFQALLPALTEEEYKQLEESLVAEGCRDAVLVWRDQIVDGHNRAAICDKHSLAYRVDEMPFVDEDEALEWIITNQLGRRNLTANQKTLYIAQLYDLQKKRHGGDRKSNDSQGENQVATLATCSETDNENEDSASHELAYEIEPQFQKPPAKTVEKVAEKAGVSPRTVSNAAKVGKALETLPPEVKEEFAAGKITQKAVIEKAREAAPAPAPKPVDDGTDDLTRAVKKHANIFLKIFDAYDTAIENAWRECKAHGHKFSEFGARLDWFSRGQDPQTLLTLRTEASVLRAIRICPKCDGKKCNRCDETGYVLKSDRDDLLREMGLKE